MEAPASRQDFAERLSQWVDVSGSITLHAAHQSTHRAVPLKPSAANRAAARDLQVRFQRVRAGLIAIITARTTTPTPNPRDRNPPPVPDASGEADAGFAPHQQRYLDLQRQMALRIEALRGDVRQTLAKVSPRLGQLAAFDAVLEQMLGSREQGLMGTVPVVLERQFENRRAAHRQAQDATQPTDDPALWRQPGGWLHSFARDMEAALLAELESPAAAGHGNDGSIEQRGWETPMNRTFFTGIFALGLAAVVWVGFGFVGSSPLALLMTAVIAGVYGLGAFELHRYRTATASLATALDPLPQPLTDLSAWLAGVHPSLQPAVRQRIEGERTALPGPALTPYLVGLLVMLGMLGTFLGMVVTFKGAVFALEGSTDLQAIRSALAAPIKGLGLSFGTSVAGVAASSMLGLMSALSRRERVDVGRLLDSRIATVFRPFSLAHQRQETYRALQVQATTLPEVVNGLQALMEGMERSHQQLNEQLLASQAQFHREVTTVYTGLADSVGQSLNDALTASARLAGESIKPVVVTAMAEIAQESKRLHERASDAAQAQLNGLSAAFSATAATVSDTWAAALQTHARTGDAQVQALDRALDRVHRQLRPARQRIGGLGP
jgi:hypothetical protein